MASLLNDIASEAIYPLLPTFLLSLGGSKTLLGFLEGLADTTSSLLKLWAGHASDQSGKRKSFIVFGYTLTSLSRPLMALSTASYHVLFIRLFDRIGKGLRSAPRDALIAESTDPSHHGRAFGFHRAMDHLGAAIGPALAALFLWFMPGQIRILMLLTIIPGIMVVLLQSFLLKDSKQQNSDVEKERPLKSETFSEKSRFHWPTGSFRNFLLALMLFTFANSTDVFLLVRAEEIGVPVLWLPLLWGCFHVLKSFGNYRLGSIADRRSPKRLIVAGWLLYALVYLGFGFVNAGWQVWVLFGLYAVFYSLTEPAEKNSWPSSRSPAVQVRRSVGFTPSWLSLTCRQVYSSVGCIRHKVLKRHSCPAP
ncbi:MAG: MFS transporter [Pirellulales bacterium]